MMSYTDIKDTDYLTLFFCMKIQLYLTGKFVFLERLIG